MTESERAVMQQALDALYQALDAVDSHSSEIEPIKDAINLCEAAMAQPEQPCTAWHKETVIPKDLL